MIYIKGICYIIAACKDTADDIVFFPNEKDLIIAADGGYDILKIKNIVPDILLGDFDSIEKIPDHPNIVKHPVCKDDTDTFLAYKLAYEKGYRNFVIFGGIGGRIDHTFANIQTISNISQNGGRGFLVGGDTVISAISDSKIVFSEGYSGNISVFAQGKSANGVSISGLKYCVQDISMESSITLGVSNEFVGERAEISVLDGTLIVMWYEKITEFLKNINNFLLK